MSERHHFKIRVDCKRYQWPYQMAAVEPVPEDMTVEAWYEDYGFDGAVVYEGWHGASPESLETVARLMIAARGEHR